VQLDAYHVFPRAAELSLEVRRQYKTVPLSALLEPEVAFRDPAPERVKRLAESILAVGLLQPLIVTPKGNAYSVLDGYHRFLALKALAESGQGPSQVPVVVLWAENPNARYGLYLMAAAANLEREEAFDLGEALRRFVLGLGGEAALLEAQEAARAFKGLPDPSGYVEALLEAGEPVPYPLDFPGAQEAFRGVRSLFWFHLLAFFLEGLVPRERIPSELQAALLGGSPARETASRQTPSPPQVRTVVIELPEVRRPSDFKRFARNAAKAIALGLKGVKLGRRDLERPEVKLFLERLREAVALLEALRAQGAQAEEAVEKPFQGARAEELGEGRRREEHEVPLLIEEDLTPELAQEVLEEAKGEL